ncbi:metalloendoproteinase 1-MMP-like [Iris pallida]|uniref:Metalloendoproteinase 1-MMP-like n=1 Tax=Iris pallida TaxID=29817 RepID=A0AAX6FCG5_IRIPA|nr:metalloendoproteinase 1-MMP-like [Iris pallida]
MVPFGETVSSSLFWPGIVSFGYGLEKDKRGKWRKWRRRRREGMDGKKKEIKWERQVREIL